MSDLLPVQRDLAHLLFSLPGAAGCDRDGGAVSTESRCHSAATIQ